MPTNQEIRDRVASSPTEANDFFAATGISDPELKQAVYELVKDLKAAGLWNKLKAIYPFIGGNADAHKYNLKDARDEDSAFRITWAGGVTHSSLGIKGDGATGYGNTHLNINSHLAFDNMNFSIFSRDTTEGETGMDIGTILTNLTVISARFSGYAGGVFRNEGGFGIDPNSIHINSHGLFTVNQNGDSLMQAYRNGWNFKTSTTTISNPSNSYPFFIAANNSNVGAANFSERQIGFACIGDKLPQYEETQKYFIIQKYINALDGNSAFNNQIKFYHIQPASIIQSSFTLKINTGKTIYINWGEGAVQTLVGDGSNQTATSIFTTGSKTSYGRIYGDIQDIIKFHVVASQRLYGLNINEFSRLKIPLYSLNLSEYRNAELLNIPELPKGLTEFNSLGGSVTAKGRLSDLPKYLQAIYLTGSDSFSSEGLANLPATLLRLYIYGWDNDIISIDNLPANIGYVAFDYCATATGSIKNLPNAAMTYISFIECGAGINITATPLKAWPNAFINLKSSYSTANVDAFLNAFSAVAASGATTIDLAGSNGARSAASDAAVANLVSLLKTVITN